MTIDHTVNDRSGARFEAMLASPRPARLPNREWHAFITGPLTADDWALIGRVERGEVSVDDAMAGRPR